MQKLITISGIQIPIYQIMRHPTAPSLEIKIRESELSVSQDALIGILKNSEDLSILTLKTIDGVFMNQYHNYSLMDTYSVKYGYVIQRAVDAVEGIPAVDAVLDEEGNVIQEAIPEVPAVPEVPEIVDNLITVYLLQKSALEIQVESTTQLVDAMSVAIANILGV